MGKLFACSQGLLAEYARAVLAEKVLRFHRIQAIGIFSPLCRVRGRINELARRVTNKTMERVSERVAITKEWILRELLDNAELAKADGSWAARNRSLELDKSAGGVAGVVHQNQTDPGLRKILQLGTRRAFCRLEHFFYITFQR